MMTLLFSVRARPRLVEDLATLPKTGYVWLDFVREESPDWALRVHELTGVDIHPAHVVDSLNLDHPSFTDHGTDYEMIVFRGLMPASEDGAIQSWPTVLFLLERAVVTVRPADSRSVVAVRERILGGKQAPPRRPVGLVHLVLTTMVDRYLEVREELTRRLDRWQTELLDPADPFDDWQLVLRQRGGIKKLEILCQGQDEAVVNWMERTRIELDDTLRIRFHDLLEHIRRVLGHAQHLQMDVDATVQMHFSAVAFRTNEIMRVLTVLSAIFLPLTFIAGVFGMNFVNMPELHYENAYFIALAAMLILGLGLTWHFHRKKWF